MNEIINTVVQPGVIILGVAIYFLTSGLKRFVELIAPNLKKLAGELSPSPMFTSTAAMWWNVASIHLIPVTIGLLAGLIHSDFLFHGVTDWGGRVLFGGGIGWFSGTIYKGVDKALTGKLGITPTVPPPAGTP